VVSLSDYVVKEDLMEVKWLEKVRTLDRSLPENLLAEELRLMAESCPNPRNPRIILLK